MRGLIGAWVVCAGVGWSGVALAAPASGAVPASSAVPASDMAPTCDVAPTCDTGPASGTAPVSDPRSLYRCAKAHDECGDPEGALQVTTRGLETAPADLDLLRLQGKLLIGLDRLPEALAAFQAFLRAGATGKEAQDAQTVVNDLTPVLSTFIDIAVDNAREAGPARIYLDAAGRRLLCSAAPACHHAMLPQVYTLTAVAERPGFEHWTGQITVERNQTATLRITFAHKPSLLTVTVTPPGARIAVDGAVYGGPAEILAGKHRLVISRAGYIEQQQEITASSGNPVVLVIALMKNPDVGGSNARTAVGLSLGGTAVSWALVAAAIRIQGSTAKWTIGTIGAAGILFGPSLGHWYAHSYGTPGFSLRAMGVAVAAISAAGCVWDRAYVCGSAEMTLWVLGGALYTTGTATDIVTAPGAVRNHLRASAGTTVIPTIQADHRGLAVAGWF